MPSVQRSHSRTERHASTVLQASLTPGDRPTLEGTTTTSATKTTRTLSNPHAATSSKKYNSLHDREATIRLRDLRLGGTLRVAKTTVGTSTTCPQPTWGIRLMTAVMLGTSSMQDAGSAGSMLRASTHHDLSQVKQEENKTLRSYTRRFFKMRATIANITNEDEDEENERFPKRNNDNRSDKGQRNYSGSSRKRKLEDLVAAVERNPRGKKSGNQLHK
ncbi:hypothetical protein C2845_PM04G11650 [Panicum miliaceum]|uniref:Uncharacterized protein n=1 Tax=Panicum miliaceum TaxID=4540 RepID=A0A3L6QR58_PANMI|nr:hypothetical protein C2845_PM04G11650 [Panicum miliaceum]